MILLYNIEVIFLTAKEKVLFTKAEWKLNLIGCMEILLFMPVGVDRFNSSRSAAVRSFLVPIALLPILLAVMVAMSEGFPLAILISLHMIRIILSAALFFVVVYFLSKQFERQEHFYKFVNVVNWSNIPGVLLTLPILVALLMGYDVTALESYAVFITIVGYVYSAFILTHCFRFPWEMGGFIAIVGLAIDQNLLDVTVYIRDLLVA